MYEAGGQHSLIAGSKSRALFAEAVVAIDAFLRALRRQCCPTQLMSDGMQSFLELKRALDATAHCLASSEPPPEPLLRNYRARLETLSFELHRLEPLLRQEHAHLFQTLNQASTRRAWAAALSHTQ